VPLNISNTGTAALTVSAIVSSNPAVTPPATPFTVQPGATTAVNLTFAPTAAGTINGNLTITSNDPAHGQIMVAFTGTAGAQPTAAPPVAWWKFDEGSGTTASDSSGNGNTGTLTGGVTWITGVFGDAVSLDGSTGYLQGSSLNDFPLGGAARTISAWVKVSNAPTADNAILHYGAAPGTVAQNFHLYMTGSPAGHIGLGNGYGYGTITSVKNVADGNWHLVVGEYDGSTSTGGDGLLHIYIDGALDSSGTPSTTPATAAGSNWRIGQFIAGGTPFHGALDDVRVYARALSLTDIQALMAGAATGTGGGTPSISPGTASLQLGSVTVGQVANVPLNISNTGTAPLTVSGIVSSSAAVIATSPALPFTVQPGASTPVNVQFTPASAGAVSGSLTITSNDPAHGQIAVLFTGTGLAAAGSPVIGASTPSLAFGSLPVGQLTTLIVNVTNTGSAALTVSSISISNQAFGLITPGAPFTVQPGASTGVELVFAPTSAAAQSGFMTINSNDATHPVVTVTLTGTGTGTPSNLLAYGNVQVGQSITGVLTLQNTGSATLTVTSMTTTNPVYTVTSPTAPFSIPAGQSAPISVNFKPATYSGYIDTLTIVTSAGNLSTMVSGAGVH